MTLHRIIGPTHALGVLLAAAVVLLAGCGKPALGGRALEGVVLDATTLQPVPGAMVLIKWRGTLPTIHSNSVPCYHVELATTDENGRYHTNAWFIWTKDHAPWVAHINQTGPIEPIVYKAGYVMQKRSQDDWTRVLIEPFKGTALERLGYLSGTFYQYESSCDADTKSQIPLYQAAYQEGISLARSTLELRELDSLLVELESAQFGNEVALRRAGVREVERAKMRQ